MNEILERAWEEAQSAWRFRWTALGVATVLALLGWTIVFALPDRYKAEASVFVDTSTALQPVLRGLAVEQDLSTQLSYVRQSLLNGDRLKRIAKDAGILSDTSVSPKKEADVLDSFSDRITLAVAPAPSNERAGITFNFSYRDADRGRSVKVVGTVLNAFVEETLGGKRRGSKDAQKFLEAQIRTYEERLREAENRLAEFKKANVGLMPTEQGDYFAQLQSQIDQSKTMENNLNVALSRRAELARQLRGESVIGAIAPVAAGGVGAATDTRTRLQEAQSRVDELLLRFTEKHPDVVAARATLAELQARRAAEIENLKRGDAAAVASSGVSANPVYQNIQLQLNQTDVEIASLRGQLAQHLAKAAELRQRLDVAPQVEARYAQLNRDYDINKAQYTALLASYEKTRLGEEADTAGSVRFEIVEPPTAAFTPATPPRQLLLLLVPVVAMLLGAGVAFLLHKMNPVIGSLRGLSELTGYPVLGAVSPAFPELLGAQARLATVRFLGATATLGGVYAVVLFLNFLGLRLHVFGKI